LVVESNVITIIDDRKPVGGVINKHKSIAYPNPSTNTITVEYFAEKSSRFTFQLTDITGRLLSNTQANAIQGNNRTSINVSPFVKGTYFINLIKPDGTKESLQIIKK